MIYKVYRNKRNFKLYEVRQVQSSTLQLWYEVKPYTKRLEDQHKWVRTYQFALEHEYWRVC